ncbi:MAG: hypothetical protein Q9214_005160 [Letrouitia sp. 1 TL-2023]
MPDEESKWPDQVKSKINGLKAPRHIPGLRADIPLRRLVSTVQPSPTPGSSRSDVYMQPATSSSQEPQNGNEQGKSKYAHGIPFQPAFEYNASLHPLDTAAPQTNPAIVSPQPPTPLSAGLRIETQPSSQPEPEKVSSLSPHFPPLDIEIPLYQAFSSSGVPGRSGSLRSALSASRSRAGSLSPGSALSSPGVGPLVEMTPLPSPLGIGSPSAWKTSFDAIDLTPPAVDTITIDGVDKNDGYLTFARTSPKKPMIPLRIDAEARKVNAATHARNRSLSDYVPDGLPIPRNRNVAVSSSIVPISATPHSPPDQHMHREEYLAVQRGLALPIKPPTPPRSDLSAASSESEARPLSPPVQKGPLPLTYEAQMIHSGAIRRWIAVRQLGKGTFSTVMLAASESTMFDHGAPTDEQHIDPRNLVAVKVCDKGPAGGADEKKIDLSLKRELEILKSIDHPSLVHLQAVSNQDRRALLVLNYCPGGDLFDLASLKLDLLIPSLVRRIFSELVAAVRCLHEQYIVHRDIKLENVLVNLPVSSLPSITDWQTHPYPVVTLTDLGLGRWIPKPPESPLLDTRCGSEDYAAPELLMGNHYDGRATDTWALGVLLYSIMEGRLPFDPIPGSRRKSPTSHRIARCEWSWVRWADGNGDWDPVKGQALEGGREIVEGLLLRTSRRWSLDKVAQTEWVSQGLAVEGGLKRMQDEGESESES